MTSLAHKDQNDNVVLGIAYEYDLAGNRTAITYTGQNPFLQGRHTYTYDSLNRLTSADHPEGSVLPDETYTYDAVGNRTSSHISSTYTYNAANRLLSDDQFTYTYDAVGNLRTRTRRSNGLVLKAETVVSSLFTIDSWTYEGQSIQRMHIPDALMRRTHEADHLGGGNMRGRRCWVYDNEDWVLEYTQTLDVAAGNYKNDIAKIATHGPGIDEPLMISIRNDLVPTLMAGPGGTLSCSTCMQDTYPLTDALGSVLCLVDDTGALVQSYAYDSFGRVMAESGGIPNEYGFTGREVDMNSGMMQYRNRWYDPGTGRFVSEDPLGNMMSAPTGYYALLATQLRGSKNTISSLRTFSRSPSPRHVGPIAGSAIYGYALSNPNGFVDPYGLLSCPKGSIQTFNKGIFAGCMLYAGTVPALTCGLGLAGCVQGMVGACIEGLGGCLATGTAVLMCQDAATECRPCKK